jgi:hypothetical protein
VTNEHILLLLDGEGSEAERRRIERHLTDCWQCRFRCEEMQSAIHRMVECRNLVVDTRLNAEPPSSRALLAARIEEQREALAARPRAAAMWFAGYRQAALAAGVCCAVVLVTLAVWRKQKNAPVAVVPASAQETLHQAVSAESAESVPAGQVRHRSMLLEIRNVTKAVDMAPRRVEVWDDATHHRSAVVDGRTGAGAGEGKSRRAGARSSVVEAAEVKQGADEAPMRAVPSGFESLRAAEFSKLVAEPAQLSITRSQTLETLVYQPVKERTERRKQPRILLARLDLRAVDLHPVAERLAVVDDSETWEFRLSEEADVDVPLASVPTGTFGRPASAAPAAGMAAASTSASLDNAIDVLTVLDGAGALTQQDVQLQRSANGGLQVSGVVQDDVRRQALLQLLQPNVGHGLKLQISTVAEQTRPPRTAGRSVLVVDGDPNSESANVALTEYFTSTLHLPTPEAERRRLEMENQLLAWSNDAESQAEALHEVFSLSPQSEVSTTSLQVRREWESLVQHHASALERDLAQMETTLGPLKAARGVPACSARTAAATADSSELLSATRRISTSVSNFVAPTAGVSPGGVLNPAFGCLVASTKDLLSRLTTPPPEP